MYQCSVGLQKTVSYCSNSSSVHTEVVWQLWNQGRICKKKRSGHPRVSGEAVRQVEATCNGSLRKTVRKEAVSYRCRKRLCGRGVGMKPYNATLPNRWIVRVWAADEEWMKWPPCSPDLTPCDFFLWGYVNEQVFVPPLSEDINELKLTITATIETIDRNILGRAWDQLD
jgi:hypothetical protein